MRIIRISPTSQFTCVITMILLLIPLFFVGVLGEADFTLPGICPEVKLQEKFDYNSFLGVWHQVGGYRSDNKPLHDCATLDFQKVDQGYALKETHVEDDEGKRIQMWYNAKVNASLDPENYTQFLVERKALEDHLVQYPYMILSTDYNDYAIAYVCTWLKEKDRKHYVYTWILTRGKEKLNATTLKKIEEALSQYKELAEHRQNFVFKEFNNATCAFEQKAETNFFDSYYC